MSSLVQEVAWVETWIQSDETHVFNLNDLCVFFQQKQQRNRARFILPWLETSTWHGFIESARLEMTSANPAPSYPPLNHLQVSHSCVFWTFQCWWSQHVPGQPCPMLGNPYSGHIFPNIQSKATLVQFQAVSSHPWHLHVLSTDCRQILGELFRQHCLPGASSGQTGEIWALQAYKKISAA